MKLRLLAALAIVCATGWWLGSFRTEVFHRGAVHLYSVDFQGAKWIQAPGGGPRSYFLYDLDLPATPDSATLWLDANQYYVAYVNGREVDTDARDIHAGIPPRAHAVDLTRWLTTGLNAIGLQVTNDNGGTASVRARIALINGSTETDFTSSESGWKATSNLALVKPRGSLRIPQFSNILFQSNPNPTPRVASGATYYDQWTTAIPSPTVRTAALASVPEQVMEQPYTDGFVIGTPTPGQELAASTIVNLPGQPSDGWIRVAASGPYGLYVNGDLLTYRTQPAITGKGVPAEQILLYNLGRFLHPGANVLAFHVTASPVASLFVDGSIQTSGGTVDIGTGNDKLSPWSAASYPFGNELTQPDPTQRASIQGAADCSGQPAPAAITPGVPTIPTGTPTVASCIWPQGLAKTVIGVNKVDTPPSVLFVDRFGTLGGTLALWLLVAGLVSLAGRIPFSRALVSDALGQLPGMAAIAATEQFARLRDLLPPFPHVPAVLLLLLGTVFAGKLVSALVVSGALDPAFEMAGGAWRALRRVRVPRPGLALPSWAHRWEVIGVGVIALVCGAAAAYRIGYQPLWQDELASLVAAQGMRAHLVPLLPSGLLYWKGELYGIIIAIIGGITGDTATPLRLPSAFWYVGTILAFGLLLVPVVLGRRRPLVTVATTALFATAPMELLWSDQVRMYQQAQFFAVLFVVFFARAMRNGRTRTIVAAALSLVLMYLSHEETFIFLPAIPLVFLGVMRLRWIRDWRWWVYGGGAFLIIGIQYALANKTHPPYFGYDHSDKPYVVFDAHNFFWYLSKVYFPTSTRAGSLILISSFAVVAGVVGIVRRNFWRIYMTAFLWLPVLALSTIFSPKIARYVFITMPLLFVLGAVGALDVLGLIRRLLSVPLATIRERRAVVGLVAAATIPAFAWLGLSLTSGAADYGLAVAQVVHATESYQHVDYGTVGAYVKAHMQPGDLLLTLAPPDDPAYYVGRAPDMVIATGRDKLIFLMEKNGQAVDTVFGVPAILTADDLQHVIDNHKRIWIVTDQGPYLNSVSRQITQMILSNFDTVAESATAAVYFRGD